MVRGVDWQWESQDGNTIAFGEGFFIVISIVLFEGSSIIRDVTNVLKLGEHM